MKATREQFNQLVRDLVGPLTEPDPMLFDRIEAAYSSPMRRYHTLEHIGWGLKRIDDMADEDRTRGAKFQSREWDLIRWAFWFHDWVSAGEPTDEEVSGNEASRAAQAAGLGYVECATVARLVVATAHDRVPLRHDEAIICDADLSILGANEEAFDRYEQLVREEWAHVPDLLFATARAVILRRFAARPWIYMTDYGRTRWERKARANLGRSLAKLGEATK